MIVSNFVVEQQLKLHRPEKPASDVVEVPVEAAESEEEETDAAGFAEPEAVGSSARGRGMQP